jgi:hypothetical protein
MKCEYDFAGAESGKLHRPNVGLIPPVHVDPEVLNDLAARAESAAVPRAVPNALDQMIY